MVMEAKKLLDGPVNSHSAKIVDAIWEQFNDTLPEGYKIGRALSTLMLNYLQADEFDRVMMLNPEIPIREILQKMIRDELLFLKREEMIKEALSKHARDPETVQGSNSGSNGAEQEAP